MSILPPPDDFPALFIRVPPAVPPAVRSGPEGIGAGAASSQLDFGLSQTTQFTQLSQESGNQCNAYLLKCQFDDSAAPTRLDLVALSNAGVMYSAHIDASSKPKSQDALSSVEYLRETYGALAGPRENGDATSHAPQAAAAYSVSVDEAADSSSSSSSSSGLRLTIKKKIHGSTAQLLWAKATLAVMQSANSSFSFAEIILAENMRQVNIIAAMKQRNVFLESAARNLTDDLSVLQQAQDELNKSLVTKMCLLLNSKKKEIVRLRGLISSNGGGSAARNKRPMLDAAAAEEEEENAEDSDAPSIKRPAKRAKAATTSRARKTSTLKASKPDRSVGPDPAAPSQGLSQLLAAPAATLEITSMDLDERLSQPLIHNANVTTSAPQDSERTEKTATKAVIAQDTHQVSNFSQSQGSSTSSASISTQQQQTRTRAAPKRSLKRLIDSSSDDENSKAGLDDASSYLM